METNDDVQAVPAVDDEDRASRIEKSTQAIVFALLTANEQPYPLAIPAATKVAEMLDDHGWRLSGEVVADAGDGLPGWIKERSREEAAPLPEEPDHHAMQPTDRITVAPPQPKRIAKKLMGVVEGP